MLHTHVNSLNIQHFHRLLAVWSNGKAKPKTKRRLINTLNFVWAHGEHLRMFPLKPWANIKIPGDGTKEPKRALTKVELKKIDDQLSNSKWSIKRPELLKFAKLNLTQYFHGPDADAWDEAAIEKRTTHLYSQLEKIWP